MDYPSREFDDAVAAESLRYDQWPAASERLNRDPSLLVHFDFEHVAPSDWRLPNASGRAFAVTDGTNQFGMWLHLAVTLGGNAKRVVHYVNGLPVGEKALKIKPPFRIGAAELGNWNTSSFPDNDRRSSATSAARWMNSAGKPQPKPLIQTRK